MYSWFFKLHKHISHHPQACASVSIPLFRWWAFQRLQLRYLLCARKAQQTQRQASKGPSPSGFSEVFLKCIGVEVEGIALNEGPLPCSTCQAVPLVLVTLSTVCDLIKSQQSWAVLGLPCVFQPKWVAQPSAEGHYWPMCMLALGLFTLRTCKCKAHSSLLHRAPSESWLKCRQDCPFNKGIYRVWINLPAYFHVTDLGTSQLGEGVSVLWGHCWCWEMIAFFLKSKVTLQTSLPSFEILILHKSPCHFVKQWAGPLVCSVQIYACWDSLPGITPPHPFPIFILKNVKYTEKTIIQWMHICPPRRLRNCLPFATFTLSLYTFLGRRGWYI